MEKKKNQSRPEENSLVKSTSTKKILMIPVVVALAFLAVILGQTLRNNLSSTEAEPQPEQSDAEVDKTLKTNEVFLAKVKKEPGVKELPGGVLYKVIKEGDGPTPTLQDQVEVDYEGMTIDGKVFDSSYKRGQSATFGVSQVIPGWSTALTAMPVGSEWELTIPADMAYGTHGQGNTIAPNSVLIFKVHLIGIK